MESEYCLECKTKIEYGEESMSIIGYQRKEYETIPGHFYDETARMCFSCFVSIFKGTRMNLPKHLEIDMYNKEVTYIYGDVTISTYYHIKKNKTYRDFVKATYKKLVKFGNDLDKQHWRV